MPARRRALLGLAGAALPASVPRPAAARLPSRATLLVPGPEEGGLALWSRRLAEALPRSAAAAVGLDCNVLGGPDGVTAANRFATLAAPDGRTLLVLTGAAGQARLVGDPRARFDLSGWPPVCAVQAPALVVGRAPMPASAAVPLRLGLGSAEAPASAALLALDLMRHRVTPVPGLGPAQAEAALAEGAVEAIVLQGTEALARLAALGARPWFSLDPTPGRAPLPEVPRLFDLLDGGSAPLAAALRSAGACAGLAAAVVVPALTPADHLALWRGAARRWLEEEARIAPAGVLLLAGLEATPLLSAMAAAPEASLAYREWLLRRLRWRAA